LQPEKALTVRRDGHRHGPLVVCEDGGSLTLFTVTVPVPLKCESLLVAEELVEP
jgi:hypothetical protein